MALIAALKQAAPEREKSWELLADGLSNSLRGNELDLTVALGDGLTPLLAHAAVWQILQDRAAADGGEGIVSVNLPRGARHSSDATLRDVLRAMKQLPALTHLYLPDAWDRIDLAGFKSLQRVTLGCHQHVVARVPIGVPVHSDAHSGRHWKCTVIPVDADGRDAGEHQPLQGLIYQRKATDFLPLVRDPDVSPQTLARATRLNVKARFPDDSKSAPRVQQLIVCRDIVVQWVKDRIAHHRLGRGRYSYANYMTVERLARHVDPASTADIDRIARVGAQAVFDIRNFGDMIADEFSVMTLGQTRHFLIICPFHALAVELRVKDGPAGERRHNRALVFYDPNITPSHDRMKSLDPDEARGRSLADWVEPESLAEYVGSHPAPHVAMLYRVGCDDEGRMVSLSSRSGDDDFFSRYLAAEHRLSAPALLWALADGRVGHISVCMDAMFQSAQSAAPAYLEANFGGHDGFYMAMGLGRAAAVEMFVGKILAADPAVLPPNSQVKLLSAPVAGESALAGAFMWGQPDTVEVFTRAVLHGAQALLRADVMWLLASPVVGESDQPLLHRICSITAVYAPDPTIAHRRNRAIFQHLSAILLAHMLTPAEKAYFCASPHGPRHARTTAAQAALQHSNPGAAAAMVCAVLQASEVGQEAQLMQSLGVDVRDVLSALALLGEQEHQWMAAVLKAVESSGLDDSIIAGLQRDFGLRKS